MISPRKSEHVELTEYLIHSAQCSEPRWEANTTFGWALSLFQHLKPSSNELYAGLPLDATLKTLYSVHKPYLHISCDSQIKQSLFNAGWQNYEKRLLPSSCLCAPASPSNRSSILPHGTSRLPLDGFSINLIFEYFSKILFSIPPPPTKIVPFMT